MTDLDLESVVILRTHLEEWEEIIRWAHGYHAAHDLAENYRAGRPNLKPSRLTMLLTRARTRLEGYLHEEGSDEFLQSE